MKISSPIRRATRSATIRLAFRPHPSPPLRQDLNTNRILPMISTEDCHQASPTRSLVFKSTQNQRFFGSKIPCQRNAAQKPSVRAKRGRIEAPVSPYPSEAIGEQNLSKPGPMVMVSHDGLDFLKKTRPVPGWRWSSSSRGKGNNETQGLRESTCKDKETLKSFEAPETKFSPGRTAIRNVSQYPQSEWTPRFSASIPKNKTDSHFRNGFKKQPSPFRDTSALCLKLETSNDKLIKSLQLTGRYHTDLSASLHHHSDGSELKKRKRQTVHSNAMFSSVDKVMKSQYGKKINKFYDNGKNNSKSPPPSGLCGSKYKLFKATNSRSPTSHYPTNFMQKRTKTFGFSYHKSSTFASSGRNSKRSESSNETTSAFSHCFFKSPLKGSLNSWRSGESMAEEGRFGRGCCLDRDELSSSSPLSSVVSLSQGESSSLECISNSFGSLPIAFVAMDTRSQKIHSSDFKLIPVFSSHNLSDSCFRTASSRLDVLASKLADVCFHTDSPSGVVEKNFFNFGSSSLSSMKGNTKPTATLSKLHAVQTIAPLKTSAMRTINDSATQIKNPLPKSAIQTSSPSNALAIQTTNHSPKSAMQTAFKTFSMQTNGSYKSPTKLTGIGLINRSQQTTPTLLRTKRLISQKNASFHKNSSRNNDSDFQDFVSFLPNAVASKVPPRTIKFKQAAKPNTTRPRRLPVTSLLSKKIQSNDFRPIITPSLRVFRDKYKSLIPSKRDAII